MAVLMPWQSNYFVQQTDSINEHPKFSSTDIGVLGTGSSNAKFTLPVLNNLTFPSNILASNIRLSSGRSDSKSTEHRVDNITAPTFTLNMPTDSYNLSLFLWLLLQNGSSETLNGSIYTANFVPYTSEDVEKYVAITRRMVDASTTVSQDTDSHLMLGVVCSSLVLNSDERGLLNLTTEMISDESSIYN